MSARRWSRGNWGRGLAIVAAVAASAAGLQAADASKTPAEAPVELPPMIVADAKHARPWLHAEVPGMEVLARCSDDIVDRFVQRNDQLHQLLAGVLPPDLQFQTTQPRRYLLVEDSGGSLSQALVLALSESIERRPAETGSERPTSGKEAVAFDPRTNVQNIRMLPNVQFSDIDEIFAFGVVNPQRFAEDRLTFAPQYLRLLMERRVPALPPWFIEGVMAASNDMMFGQDAIELAPLTWVTAAETAQLRNDADAPRKLYPMRDFLAAAVPEGTSDTALRWRSQAQLLLRWGMVPARRAAFWRWVAALAAGADAEVALQRELGLDLGDLRDQLSDLLPRAIAAWGSIRPEKIKPAPKLSVHGATSAEIGRLKGEWERLEYAHVKLRYPPYAPMYLALVRETLRRAREQAPADPELASVEGLLACDLGQYAEGRPPLELAAAGYRARPRVYAELAAMRMREMVNGGSYANGRLSAAQADVVLKTLALAEEQKPPLALVAALKAETWGRSESGATPHDLAAVNAALTLFPKTAPLVFYAAVLEAQYGSLPHALALARRGEAEWTVPTVQARFRDLRLKIEAAAGKK